MYDVTRAEEAGWADNALYFAAFMNAVDTIVVAETGLSLDDYPDYDWAGAFTSGLSVEEVANDFLNEVLGEME